MNKIYSAHFFARRAASMSPKNGRPNLIFDPLSTVKPLLAAQIRHTLQNRCVVRPPCSAQSDTRRPIIDRNSLATVHIKRVSRWGPPWRPGRPKYSTRFQELGRREMSPVTQSNGKKLPYFQSTMYYVH